MRRVRFFFWVITSPLTAAIRAAKRERRSEDRERQSEVKGERGREAGDAGQAVMAAILIQ